MPFDQEFERDVNKNMQGDTEQNGRMDDGDIKQHHDTKQPIDEEEDFEISEKKDRPPRFSTIFGGSSTPQIIERYIENPRKNKKGIFIPLPIFIILAIILFFETTLLFAYTIIALDNNLASGLFPVGSTRIDNCPQQQSINVAPKFYMGPAQSGAAAPDKVPTLTTSSTSSAPSTTKQKESGKTETTAVVTVTPTAVAPTSTLMLTVDEEGSTHTPTPTATDDSGKAKKRASVHSALKSIISANLPGQEDGAPKPTTLVKAKTSTGDSEATSSAAGGGGPCFGGAGAVGLVCPNGVGRND